MAKARFSGLAGKRIGSGETGGIGTKRKEPTKDSISKSKGSTNTVQIVHIHTASDDFYAVQDMAHSNKFKSVPLNLRDQLPPGAKTKSFDATKMSVEEKKKHISVLKQVSVANTR